MNTRGWGHGRGALGLAILRATLLAVILVSEQLVDARQLGGPVFYVLLVVAAGYSVAGVVVALRRPAGPAELAFARIQPWLDLALLSAIAYASGGAYSDVRKAFFVVPLAAAFSERPRTTAEWSLLAVAAFTVQAALAGGRPSSTVNTWQRLTLNQDLYLAWAGAAGTMLALGLRHRSAHIKELAASRQRLVAQAIEAVERERTRLAGALHDSPVQNLIAARHDLRRAARTGDPESFARLQDAIDVTIAELREEIFKLHPHVLDHVGLSAALEQIARRYAADGDLEVEIEIDPRAGLSHRDVLFAIGRELLGNAARHASASKVKLTLALAGKSQVLEVGDDGCGIPQARLRQALLDGHIGLAAVRERVSALGGESEILSGPRGGTVVRIVLPPRGEQSDERSDQVTARDTLRVSTT
jgi:two-component system, NarL family, sensor kinase